MTTYTLATTVYNSHDIQAGSFIPRRVTPQIRATSPARAVATLRLRLRRQQNLGVIFAYTQPVILSSN